MKPDRNDVLALMEDFADDVERMEISARDSGIDDEREKLAWAWAIYSASICASWLRLPQSDNELVEILKTHLHQVPMPGRGRTRLIPTNDGNGDATLPLPDSVTKAMGWDIGDVIEISIDGNGNLILRRRIA